jgi:hypothetical protein
MDQKLLQLKPGAPRSAHLFLAGSIWFFVGIFLMLRGSLWLYGIDKIWILIPGVVIGTLKALFMLERTANKNIRRIVEGGSGKCLGGVYSWKTWLLVFLMMGMGCLLRNSSLPKEFLGLFYVAIGWGLLFSSRKCWFAWRKEIKKEKLQC